MDTVASLQRKTPLSPPPTVPEPSTEPETILTREAANELRRRYADLSSLYVTGAELSATLEWEPLIHKMVHAAIQLIRADDAALVLVDDYRGELYVAASSGSAPSESTPLATTAPNHIIAWVVEHRETVLRTGEAARIQCPAIFPEAARAGSVICVPLIPPPLAGAVKRVMGVLAVRRTIPHAPLNRDDLELVTALCTQAAAALENARLYRELHRSNVQLAGLNEIGRNLTLTLDYDRVLNLIVEKATALLRCQAGSLLLVDPNTDELVFRVALGPAGAILNAKRLPPGAGIAGAVVRSGKPSIVNDAQSDPRHYHDVDGFTTLVTQSLLCVPLFDKESTIGALEVMNKTDGSPFRDQDRDSLAAFATQSSIALGNARHYSDLKRAFTETVKAMANAVEARDPYTAGHSERVTAFAIATARELGWTPDQIELLEIGSLLHDIGKIGVSDAILRKPGALTPEEYGEMKQHPVLGAKMLESIGNLRPILPYILYHQERYDGHGYPFGLVGTEIPIEGRILAVLDTLDAMTSDRPYRQAAALDAAVDEIVRNRGTQFDPDIVDALLRVIAAGMLRFPSASVPPSQGEAFGQPCEGSKTFARLSKCPYAMSKTVTPTQSEGTPRHDAGSGV